jgi:hypothetical protein
MQVNKILSARFSENWPSYHLIYEWEDVFSDKLSIPIVSNEQLHHYFLKKFRVNNKYLNFFFNRGIALVSRLRTIINHGNVLVFELAPSFTIHEKSVPFLIDFWKQTDLDSFFRFYRDCPLVLISSIEVFNYLKLNKCPLNIFHLPLSLPDKYCLNVGTSYEKKHSIIFAGRANKLLMNYMKEFEKKFPDIEFLQQIEVNTELYYSSNKTGVIGKFHSRSEYMALLRSCKISFYSTPGIDGGEVRTGGFNPVTPRFLELLSAQCLIMGRYPKNEETEFYELEKVCPNINSYQDFEFYLLKYIEQDGFPFDQYSQILSKHYTSKRVESFKEALITSY